MIVKQNEAQSARAESTDKGDNQMILSCILAYRMYGNLLFRQYVTCSLTAVRSGDGGLLTT